MNDYTPKFIKIDEEASVIGKIHNANVNDSVEVNEKYKYTSNKELLDIYNIAWNQLDYTLNYTNYNSDTQKEYYEELREEILSRMRPDTLIKLKIK